jgi:hypothetical protein
MAIEVKLKHDKALGAYHFFFVFQKHQWNNIVAITQLMRATIPASARDYDNNTKEWTVLEAFWPPLQMLLKQSGHFKIVEEKIVAPEDFFYNQGVASETIISKESLANQLLALLGITAQELADFNKAKKAYRKKALELHPDRNQGDGAAMSELNSVWTAYNSTVN